MRNLLEYPITAQEKLDLLTELRNDILGECRIGDMRPLLLKEIAEDVAARAEARPAVDREAVARELWNLATGCEPGEAWAWEKAIWIAAFWPEAFSCRDLVSKCFQATDAILALLSPAAEAAPSRDDAGGGG